MYDVAIIGSGPAGVSSAINLKLHDKNFIWLSSRTVSKKVERAELIKNYPGLPDVTGAELGWTFKNHCEGMGISPLEEVVTGVYPTNGYFTLLAKDKQYEAKSVILCIGVQSNPLEGEEDFLGRGISYCATCDGFLYRDKTVAVLCTDKKFESEVEFLCNIAKKAYVMPLYRDYSVKSDKAEIILKQPKSFQGTSRLEKVIFKDGSLAVDGVFILKPSISATSLLRGIETYDGHIKVNRDMSTNIKGVFAAGDCVGRPYQYVKSAGEGNTASHSAIEYLSTLNN